MLLCQVLENSSPYSGENIPIPFCVSRKKTLPKKDAEYNPQYSKKYSSSINRVIYVVCKIFCHIPEDDRFGDMGFLSKLKMGEGPETLFEIYCYSM